MGLSGSKTTQKFTPSPQQTAAANTLTSAYQAAQPATAAVSSMLNGMVPSFGQTATAANNAAGSAADYYKDVLSGSYLGSGNPYLTGMLTSTDAAIRDNVNGSFSAAGRTGSGANVYALTKAIGENENALRYQDYAAERARMDSAAAGAGSLGSSTLGSMLGLSNAATSLPLNQALQYAGGIGSLGLGGTTTTSNSQSIGSVLGGVLGTGLSGWALGGFK